VYIYYYVLLVIDIIVKFSYKAFLLMIFFTRHIH